MWRRVFGAELKRLLKTRSVLILMAAAVVLAPVLAYFPASFASYIYRDDSGREVTAEGREALLLERVNQGEFQGEITEEVLTAALKRYQDFADGYEGGLPDGIYDERVEASDYYEKVSNVDGLLNRVNEAYADPRTGIAPGLEALTEEETEGFYGQCRQHLRELLYLEGGEGERTVNAVRQAEALYDQVKMPFTYEPGVTADALEYVGIYVFLLVLICTFLMVPVFSSDYQTQADQILKCTRDGKRRLAAARIGAGLLLAVAARAGGHEDEALEAVVLGHAERDAGARAQAAVHEDAAVHLERLHHSRQRGAGAHEVDHAHGVGHVLAAKAHRATGVALEGLDAQARGVGGKRLPVKHEGPVAQRALVEGVGIKVAMTSQQRAQPHQPARGAVGHECLAHALAVSGEVVDGIACAGGEPADVVEVDALLKEDVGKGAGVARAVAAPLEHEGAVKHVADR